MRIQTFDDAINLTQSILWQYDRSPNILSLLNKKQTWYNTNQSQFWSDFYTNIFDLRTANLFGLAVWSYILNLPLFVPLNPDPIDKPIFGFNAFDPSYPDYLNSYLNFENSNFSNIQPNTIRLTLEEQRFILRLRYYQLVSNGCVTDINLFFNYLFSTSAINPSGTCWALDGLDMTMVYVFTFNISYNLRRVLVDFDLLPRPAGVELRYVVATDLVFGFGEMPAINNYQNFENGNFIADFL